MKRRGSQSQRNWLISENSCSDQIDLTQIQLGKEKDINENSSKWSGIGGECTFDNTISTAHEISLQVISRPLNIRQKSLDLQIFHNHSPQIGLSINSERQSLTNNYIHYSFCQKHPNRKAKYYAVGESTNLICSKCALGSALKGQKIEQVIAQEEKYRKTETDIFMQNLKLMQQILQLSDQENGKNKDRIQEFYDKQLKTINEVFNNLENILVEERNKIVQNIHQSMGESQKEIEEVGRKIKLFKFEIDQQDRDISNHYENIISEMDNLPFAEIMKKYFI